MSRPFRRLLLPLVLLAAAGSAQAGIFDDTEARKMITDLQRQVTDLQQQNQALADRLGKLENRVDNFKIANLVSQLDSQNDALAKLRGQLEVLEYNVEQTQKRQKDLYVDLDSRLRAVEPGGGGGTALAAMVPADKPAATTDKAPAAGEQAAYDAAFGLYKSGNYVGAVAGFKEFMRLFPDGKLASNAQYWTGMSLTAQRDYKGAIATQQKLLASWPDSNKAPDALFNIAANQLEQGDKKAARKTLEDVVAKYPLTPAADKAKHLLGSLK